jgi:hypothetical protein
VRAEVLTKARPAGLLETVRQLPPVQLRPAEDLALYRAEMAERRALRGWQEYRRDRAIRDLACRLHLELVLPG